MVKECKHYNKKRLYERGKSWKSTHLYRCQDCGEIIKVGYEKVDIRTMEQSIASKTKDALNVGEVRK